MAVRHNQMHVAEYLKAVAAASVLASPKTKQRPIGQMTHPEQVGDEGTPGSHYSTESPERLHHQQDPALSPNQRVNTQMYHHPGEPIVDLV
mmetsp:Transcript_25054/g.39351  ORF Transcript_25054/g.39351 Transcript_25054/m.39351 type:complete len:91 (-) Transcript_25054:106-378(-)